MLYLGNPSGRDVQAAMSAGRLGCMTTPRQGNKIPPGAVAAADNGCFSEGGEGYPGDDAWHAWLTRTAATYGPDRFLFAVAPDVPMDAAATLTKSRPWLAEIRALGVPAAYAAQNDCSALGLPWDDFDVLFLGGGPMPDGREWKLGAEARRLTREAQDRGKTVHMGRVNSLVRLDYAHWIGCTSVDGTFLARGPNKNLPRLLRWLASVHAQPALFGEIA